MVPLSKLLKTGLGKPHVIVLTEAHNAVNFCRTWADDNGYVVHGARTDVVVLVPKGTLVSKRVVSMREPWWWGPSRTNLRRREPRDYLQVVVNIGGVKVPILGPHLPPGGPGGALNRTGGKNKAAWHESALYLRSFLREHSELGLTLGDHNATADELEHHIADHVGAGVAMTGKVDGAIYVGLRHEATVRIDDVAGHGAGVIKLSNRKA